MSANEDITRAYYGEICRIIKLCATDKGLLANRDGLLQVHRAITAIPKAGVDPDLTVWAARFSSWSMRKSLLLERYPTAFGRFLDGIARAVAGVDTTSQQFDRELAAIREEWDRITGDFEPLMAVLAAKYGAGFDYADD